MGFADFLHSWMSSMKLYIDHPMLIPSLSISFLYMTVLAFGAQFVAFLLFSGYAPSVIGILRSIGVGFELSAVSAAPVLMKRIGPVKSAVWFVSWQAITIVAALIYSLLSEDKLRGIHVLVAGVIISRFGLWGFDLSVQVQIQQGVEAENRAKFSSIESAFQSVFEMISYASTIVFERPDQFKYPAIMSAAAISTSCLLYTQSVIRKQVSQ
jgi:iron-regulated transporter 1